MSNNIRRSRILVKNTDIIKQAVHNYLRISLSCLAVVLAFLLSCQAKRAVKVALQLPVTAEASAKSKGSNYCVVLPGCTTHNTSNQLKSVTPNFTALLSFFPFYSGSLMKRNRKSIVVTRLDGTNRSLFLYHRQIRV